MSNLPMPEQCFLKPQRGKVPQLHGTVHAARSDHVGVCHRVNVSCISHTEVARVFRVGEGAFGPRGGEMVEI